VKTFQQLSQNQKEEAIKTAYAVIRDGITSGVMEVTLIDAENQKRLEKILKHAINPRMANLMISHALGICKELERLALVVATDIYTYTDDGQVIEESKNANAI
jgi:hypothetical protein